MRNALINAVRPGAPDKSEIEAACERGNAELLSERLNKSFAFRVRDTSWGPYIEVQGKRIPAIASTTKTANTAMRCVRRARLARASRTFTASRGLLVTWFHSWIVKKGSPWNTSTGDISISLSTNEHQVTRFTIPNQERGMSKAYSLGWYDGINDFPYTPPEEDVRSYLDGSPESLEWTYTSGYLDGVKERLVSLN